MNFKIKLFSLGLAALCVGQNVMAQDSATEDGVINAVVRRPLVVSPDRVLNFGTVFAGDNSKVVPASDAVNSASFNITGQATSNLTVTFDTPTVTITKVGSTAGTAATDMTVNSFEAGGSTATDADGLAVVTVGASLVDNEGTQAAGSYEGVFTVTVVQSL